jgi:hypothetical protein
MGQFNRGEYTAADSDRDELLASLRTSAELTRLDPRRFLALLQPSITAEDRQIVDDVAFQRLLGATYR